MQMCVTLCMCMCLPVFEILVKYMFLQEYATVIDITFIQLYLVFVSMFCTSTQILYSTIRHCTNMQALNNRCLATLKYRYHIVFLFGILAKLSLVVQSRSRRPKSLNDARLKAQCLYSSARSAMRRSRLLFPFLGLLSALLTVSKGFVRYENCTEYVYSFRSRISLHGSTSIQLKGKVRRRPLMKIVV